MSYLEVLKQYWGYSRFRPLQEDIICAVMAGCDTLALMPTGGGKSICFQVPAMLKPGICIVVSPLIALMKDQVEQLKSKGIEAVAIVSGMGKREVDILLDNCVFGQTKFLYVSPERLLSELVRERIRHMQVNLFAIDEAHCISQWGYDFRPSYMQLAVLRELHPKAPILALTATATEHVVTDIQEKLAFSNGQVFRKSFVRKNLQYLVIKEENKLGKLQVIASKLPGTGIVYVRNRRKTEEIARHLVSHQISADFYHAGLDTQTRNQKQDAWKSGRTRIIVATNAFGMGIDKGDVRFVIHMDLPESLEAYYQEAGRAGRDEQKAYAILLHHRADSEQLLHRLAMSEPSAAEIKQIYHHLGNYYQLAHGAGEGLILDFDIAEFCKRFQLDALKAINSLKLLERNEYLSISEAVFLSSRVQMVADPQALYHFQIERAEYDSFIKIILRSYGGVFDHFTSIKEKDLAIRAGLSVAQVVDHLKKLQAAQILQYIPQTEKPQLQWLKARLPMEHLHIDHRHIAQRRLIHKQQVEAVIAYCEKSVCRSIQLLHYFDDTSAVPCGVCDHCRAQKRLSEKDLLQEQITNDLMQYLADGPKILPELIHKIKPGLEAEKLEVIRLLLDAGKIESNGHTYTLTN